MNDFKIGDFVWVARSNPSEKWITCPHCFGNKYLTVILGDDSRVQIDCSGCACGWEPPKGVIKTHVWEPIAEGHTITGIDSRSTDGKVEVMYWTGCSGLQAENTFSTKEEAIRRSAELIKERQAEEDKRLNYYKTKENHTWAWNATYHRNEIKRAQKELEYHTAKLAVCKAKDKECDA